MRKIKQKQTANSKSADNSSCGLQHWFVSLKLIRNEMAWSLCVGDQVTRRGLDVLSESPRPSFPKEFKESLQSVLKMKGFVVVFGMRYVHDWIAFRDLDDKSKELWQNVNKCCLATFHLHHLINQDYYRPLTLHEMHDQLYGTSCLQKCDLILDKELVSRIFFWFVTRFDHTYLKWHSERENQDLARKVGWGEGSKPPASKNWDTIVSPPMPQSSTGGKVKYVVVDVETHDWRPGRNCTRKTFIGRVVEIAWIAYDGQGNTVEQKNCLLRPHGYKMISDKARRFHGITTKCAKERGSDADLVFAHFVHTLRQVRQDGFVIAHKMEHEDCVFATNLNTEGRKIWERVPKCCTWNPQLLPLFFGEEHVGRRCGMKLSELHQKIAPGAFHLRNDAHSALVDIMMTWEVFVYFKQILEQKRLDVNEKLRWDPVIQVSNRKRSHVNISSISRLTGLRTVVRSAEV